MNRKKNFCIILTIIPSLTMYTGVEQNACRFFQQIIHPNSLVFDIGANIGDKAEIFLNCGARVVCIEPQPVCIDRLKSRFRNIDRVTVVSKGLAARPGSMKMYICSAANAISTFSIDWTQYGRFASNHYIWDKQIDVEMTTLDVLIMAYGMPQFLKIDVENFEYEVLCGLSQKVPCISFEFAIEYIHNAEKCLNRLNDLGFSKFNFAIGEMPDFVLPKGVSFQELLSILNSEKYNKTGELWGDIYAFS